MLASIHVAKQQDFNFTIHSFGEFEHDIPLISGKFRADYFAFVLVKEGKGIHNIDNKSFPIKPNSYYFSTPLHLRSFIMQKQWKGYLITFKESFLKQNSNIKVFDKFPFLIEEPLPVMAPSNEDFNYLYNICSNLHHELNSSTPYKKQLISHYLIILLYKTKELLQHHQIVLSKENNPNGILTSFKKLVNKNIEGILRKDKEHTHIWNVAEYSNHLNMESNYFGQIIKQEIGISAKDYINNKLVNQAKALLFNTNKTAAEIAATLFFSDTSNFNRFFKKHTQLTPSQYRKLNK